MADQSDVEAALVGLVAAGLYPQGVAYPSVLGRVVRVYRGWPVAAALDPDLAAGHVNISVFPEAGGQMETTRWADDEAVVAPVPPVLAASVAGEMVVFSGRAATGQVVGVKADNFAVVHRTEAGDTPESVAAVLAAYLRTQRIVQVDGARLQVPGVASLIGRVVADQPGLRQIRRQRQRFRVSCWCADPATRDAAGAAVDGALSALAFVALPDGTAGRLKFVSSMLLDQSQNAALYRRDLVYSVEYATTLGRVLPAMIFGDATLAPAGGGVVQSLLS